jgi:hypothetical protein
MSGHSLLRATYPSEFEHLFRHAATHRQPTVLDLPSEKLAKSMRFRLYAYAKACRLDQTSGLSLLAAVNGVEITIRGKVVTMQMNKYTWAAEAVRTALGVDFLPELPREPEVEDAQTRHLAQLHAMRAGKASPK